MRRIGLALALLGVLATSAVAAEKPERMVLAVAL